MSAIKKHGLGRGLSGIISAAKKAAPAGGAAAAGAASGAQKPPAGGAAPQKFREVPIAKIAASAHQARRDFDAAEIDALAESIRQDGLLQPISVRAVKDGFELIAGERRLRACKKLGLRTIPAQVVETTPLSSAVLGLIENLQRADLNPIEEALGYARLMKDFKMTQEAVAERLAKPRASVANTLRLLALEKEIQGYLSSGVLTVGHAKVLLGLDNGDMRLLAARRILEESLSVRETEVLVLKLRQNRGAPRKGAGAPAAKSAVIADLERRLESRLNARVALKHGAKGGKIVIEYLGNDDLERILGKLGVSV